MPRYKVFVINLARSPNRLASVSARLIAMDVPFERIEAVDGNTLSDNIIEQVSPARIVRKTYYRALSKGEIACSLSHRKAWKKIVDDGLDFAIVLEDDVILLDNFRQSLALIAGLPHGEWDFLKLYALKRGGKENIARQFEYQDCTLVTYNRFPLGFVGQAISRKGAESLIKHLRYVTEPADGQLKSWWEARIFPFGLLPYCVSTDLDGVSEINPSRGLEGMKQDRLVKLVNKLKRASKRMWWTPKLNKKFDRFIQNLE